MPVLPNLSKLNDVVRNNVVRETEYDELVKKDNAIQTTDPRCLVKKADYNTSNYDQLLIMILVKYYYSR